MKCQFCSNPATVHVTKVVDLKQQSLHLCEACAKQHQVLPGPKAELNLPALLQLLIGPHLSPEGEELARLACPDCGIKYMAFRGDGRLGCPRDYDVFRAGLEPILLRVHRATAHKGKSPRHADRNRAFQDELMELHRQLQAAVRAEAYEDAARLRDLIRRKEAPG